MVSLTSAPCAPDIRHRFAQFPAHLAAHIRGQPEALALVASVVTRGELGMAQSCRPKGSFLFLGPTGVGKTETAHVFTRYVFGTAPVRFDMSEYQLQKSVDKLIGEDRHDAGLLGRALKDRTQGTLLFDEIEKAHPLVLDLFLQILDEGRITLATGETLDLTGFYIVFTGNIGSREVMGMASPPFSSVKRTVLMRASQQLRPELYNRITEKVVFARLDFTTQREICERMIALECDRLGTLGHHLRLVPAAVEFLLREGYHKTLGARPLRGAIERYLQDAIAAALLTGRTTSGRLDVGGTRDRLEIAQSNSA